MIRFLLRFLGLTGLLLAGAGVIGLATEPGGLTLEQFRAAWQGKGSEIAVIAGYLLAAGLAVAALILLVELLSAARQTAGRRGALGGNVLIQVLLAIALLIGFNVFSYSHYRRWDCTRTGEFTLPPSVATELRKLRGETTVIVYQ